ncbi:MAG: hypothetical protein AB7F89_11725 [Pirellulaceae bacterium]
MKERRSLVDGLKTDPETQKLEEEFVFGSKRKAESADVPPAKADTIATPIEIPAAPPESRILPQMTGRIPVTTRCRPEVASALKRASLQRQLAGAEPFYVQDIMEEALENWLRDKGYV